MTVYDREQLIIAAYLEGKSQLDSARAGGYKTVKMCKKTLKKYGVPLRKNVRTDGGYTCDYSFFRQIDTEAKAYWLGFITADGNVRGDTYALTIGLKGSDVGHLEKFRTDLNSSHRIYTGLHAAFGKQFPYAVIKVCSKAMYLDLQAHGIVPRKSLTGGVSSLVPTDLLRHYWRGVIDGDGCLSSRFQKGKIRHSINLCGNRFVVSAFRDWMSPQVANYPKMVPNQKIFYLTYNKASVVKQAAELLYGDATVYLDRKYEKAQEMISLELAA